MNIKEYRTDFLGYPVDNINLKELKTFVRSAIENKEHHYIAVQNANKMYLTSKDNCLKNMIENASVILPENAINIGMRILRKPLKQRNMGGVHIMEELLKLADIHGYAYYLLGAKQENLEKLILELKKKYRLRIENCIGTIVDVYKAMSGELEYIELQHQIENLKESIRNLDMDLVCEGDVLMVERATNILLGEFKPAFKLGQFGPVYFSPSGST